MSVEVKVHYYEVVEALELYLKENYKMDVNLDIFSENCVLSEGIVEVEYRELDPVYKKHKNGRMVKNQYGHPIIDYENSEYVKRHLSFDERASFVFSVNNKDGY
tara:strand:+ start:1965 stop:2276 length:312 start_codon:yes stop_codon:yes gene_type:complete